MKKAKHEIITFKADAALLEAMKGIPNRSEFIRNSILAALDSACPLCSGTGVLTPQQKRHLQDFLVDHSLRECEKCHDHEGLFANTVPGKTHKKRWPQLRVNRNDRLIHVMIET